MTFGLCPGTLIFFLFIHFIFFIMKKFLQSLFAMMLVFTAFSAKAQDSDFSATVSWDTPGSIQVLKGSSPAYGTPVEIADDATSFTVTEKEEYMFLPTAEYYIESATMDGASQNLTKDYTNGGYYYKLPAKYQSSKYNGQTVELVMSKYEVVGTFTLDIENGADKLTLQIWDANGNQTQTVSPVDGTQTITLRNVDTQLYVKASGYPAPALYKATLNGEDVPQETNGSYIFPLSPDANVVLALKDPASIVPVTVTFNFTNNNPACIGNIRDWTESKFIMPAELEAKDYVLTTVKGEDLQINFDTDNYTVNSVLVNGEAIASAPYRFKVEEDSEVTINATAIGVEEQSVTVYSNNIEGLTFSSAYDGEADLKLEFVAEHAANTVTFENGYTIPEATSEYTLSGVFSKTNRFFFQVNKDYYIKEGVLNVKEDGQIKKLDGIYSAAVEECPVFFNVGKYDFNTPAVLYYEGTEDSSVRVTSTNPAGESAMYEGQTTNLAEGYSQIKFDPDYNTAFSVRFADYGDGTTYKYYVYVDGVAQSASSDSEMLFSGIVLKENSVLKAFYAKTAPVVRTLNFTVEEGASATLTYDKYITTSDFSAPIKNVGDVEYTFAPAEGTSIIVNGETLAAPYTFTPTTTTVAVEIVKTPETPELKPVMEFSTKPADGATVKTLSSIVVKFPMTAALMNGETSIDLGGEISDFITVGNGTETYGIAEIEMTGFSMESQDYTITLAEEITAAGEYTINIEPGLFLETVMGENYDFTANGNTNVAKTIKFTVDPNFVYQWSFNPANGSEANPLPTEDDDFVAIYMMLPDAESLSSTPFDKDGAVGPWLTYNESPLTRTTYTEDYEIATQGVWEFVPAYTDEYYGKPVVCIAINKSVFDVPGTLTIRAEEGAFTVDGQVNQWDPSVVTGGFPSPALEFSAQFGEEKEYSYTLTPAPGEYKAEEVRTITLTFDDAETVEFNDFYAVFSTNIWLSENYASIEGNVVTITIPEDVEIAPGMNVLSIGKGSFKLDGTQLSPAVYGIYTIIRTSEISFDWNPTPNIDIVNIGYGINAGIAFGEEETVARGDKFSEIVVKFNGEELGAYDFTNPDNMGYSFAFSSDNPNVFMIDAIGGSLFETATTGTLEVFIPAGALKVSGLPTPEDISYTWNFIEQKNYNVVVTPAENATVGEIKEVIVEFPEAETAELFHIYSISLRKSDYSYYETATNVEAVEGAEHPTFKITFANNATESGEYDFVMYEGAFNIDGAQTSPEVRVLVTVDSKLAGISGIASEDGKYTVVSLSGIVILKDAEASALENLPKGIYIINGKKVAVK